MRTVPARYPHLQHTLVALPTLFMCLTILLSFSSEQQTYRHFDELEQVQTAAATVLKYVASYGNVPLYCTYAWLLYAGIRRRCCETRRFVITYLLSLVFTLAFVEALKTCIGRPRPGVPGDEFIPFLDKRTHESFPSGHMTESTITTVPLARRCGGFILPLLYGCLNAAMGYSRIFTGAHHPSDILFSLFLGGVITSSFWHLSQLKATRRVVESILALPRRRA
ncbi:MAG: phosphatase PAP2 family protein [Planctomycetaceae bacterium]|nr:phosphatase PAP2 family protein [Planctomycetaceae bacterium]